MELKDIMASLNTEIDREAASRAKEEKIKADYDKFKKYYTDYFINTCYKKVNNEILEKFSYDAGIDIESEKTCVYIKRESMTELNIYYYQPDSSGKVKFIYILPGGRKPIVPVPGALEHPSYLDNPRTIEEFARYSEYYKGLKMVCEHLDEIFDEWYKRNLAIIRRNNEVLEEKISTCDFDLPWEEVNKRGEKHSAKA